MFGITRKEDIDEVLAFHCFACFGLHISTQIKPPYRNCINVSHNNLMTIVMSVPYREMTLHTTHPSKF